MYEKRIIIRQCEGRFEVENVPGISGQWDDFMMKGGNIKLYDIQGQRSAFITLGDRKIEMLNLETDNVQHISSELQALLDRVIY